MVERNPSAEAAAQAGATAALSAGAMLRQARERAGLSREAVAEQLNLLPSHVAALEQDEFKCFPGETFVKGHLRSCARLLKLDPQALLQAYGGQPAVTQTASAPSKFHWRPVSLEVRTSRWRRYFGVAAAMLVVLSLWGWHQHRDKAQVLSLTAGVNDDHAFGGIDSALNSGAESALMDSVQLLPNPQPANPAAAPTSSAPAAAGAVPVAANSDQLTLRFSADCWIEIKDRDNKLLVATLKHADEQLQVEGRGPFKVLLGYAPGVVMAYNGTPVKVDVTEGSRSTRLIVGSS